MVVNWISCRIFHIYPSDSIIISFSAICHSIAVSPLQICPNCQCQFKRYWVPLALELTSGAKSQCLALQSSAIIKTIPPHIHCQLPLHILQQFVKGLLLPSRRQVACAELELDCCCCYPAGRGPYLPSRRQVACTELELDCCCYNPAGRGPRPPLRRQVACAELELDCCCCYPTGQGQRRRVARWRARSWSWTAAAATRQDEVHTFLRAWRTLSWSWTAAATILLDEVRALLRAGRWRAQSWSWPAAVLLTRLIMYMPAPLMVQSTFSMSFQNAKSTTSFWAMPKYTLKSSCF